MNWTYTQPVEIIFGNGKRKELNQFLPDSKGLLITSPSFMKNGVAKEIQAYSQRKITNIFSEVTPNPDVQQCQKCLQLFKHEKYDFIVALGGGSVIDLAKVISVVSVSQESVSDWMNGFAINSTKHLPLIAIPTTAGTGSEVTCIAVISNHELGTKVPLSSKSFYPKLAIIDPQLTYSVSKHMSACTGMDVLCHAIEAYWSKNHQPICDALSIHAIRLVLTYLKLVYQDGENHIAREKMAEASIIAGLAFTLPKTTASHACSYPLTNVLGIAHGEACGLTIDYFMKLNHDKGCKRVKELANLSGFLSVDEMANHIRNLKKELGMLCDLSSYHISTEKLNDLIEGSLNNTLKNNPVEISYEDLQVMFSSMI